MEDSLAKGVLLVDCANLYIKFNKRKTACEFFDKTLEITEKFESQYDKHDMLINFHVKSVRWSKNQLNRIWEIIKTLPIDLAIRSLTDIANQLIEYDDIDTLLKYAKELKKKAYIANAVYEHVKITAPENLDNETDYITEFNCECNWIFEKIAKKYIDNNEFEKLTEITAKIITNDYMEKIATKFIQENRRCFRYYCENR